MKFDAQILKGVTYTITGRLEERNHFADRDSIVPHHLP